MTGHTKEPEIKINLADTRRNTEPPFLILFRREGEPMFGVSCKGEITVSKHYPPDEVAQAVLDALSGALAQIYERERAALAIPCSQLGLRGMERP